MNCELQAVQEELSKAEARAEEAEAGVDIKAFDYWAGQERRLREEELLLLDRLRIKKQQLGDEQARTEIQQPGITLCCPPGSLSQSCGCSKDEMRAPGHAVTDCYIPFMTSVISTGKTIHVPRHIVELKSYQPSCRGKKGQRCHSW